MIALVRKILAGFIGVFSYFTLVFSVFAQATTPTTNPTPIKICPEGSAFSNLCKLSATNLGQLVSNIINIILIIAVIIAVIFLIYGGIKWILSGGDKSKVEEARNHIVAAIVGLIIALVAFFVLNFILQFFLQKDINEVIVIPRLIIQ